MEEKRTHPPYRVETRRLVLRCYEPTDAARLLGAVAANREHLGPWMPWAREVDDLEQRLAYVRRARADFDQGRDFHYGVFDSETGDLVGGTGLHPRRGPDAFEIGYWIHHARCGQGLATEVTSALVRVAFELCGVHRIEIHCDPENEISARIPASLGFRHDGTLRHQVADAQRGWRDSMVWTQLADEFPGGPCAAAELCAYDLLGRPLPYGARTTPPRFPCAPGA